MILRARLRLKAIIRNLTAAFLFVLFFRIGSANTRIFQANVSQVIGTHTLEAPVDCAHRKVV
jgi:hypothetical protein